MAAQVQVVMENFILRLYSPRILAVSQYVKRIPVF